MARDQNYNLGSSVEVTASNITNLSNTSNSYQVCSFPNTSAYPNPSNFDFTLSAENAPIGSWVIMSCEIYSGSSSGDQYAYLYQQNTPSGSRIGGGIDGWYWYELHHGLFYIGAENQRSFNFNHATISASNVNDYRKVQYHGYLMGN